VLESVGFIIIIIMIIVEWCHFQCNDLEWSLTQISRSWSYYRCPRCIVCAADIRSVCDS